MTPQQGRLDASAANFGSKEAERTHIEAAFRDGRPGAIAAAIGDVARARGMTYVAREAGLSREAMYKAFRSDGNPTLSSLQGVLHALGFSLDLSPR